jgi:hypothetical protein
MSKLDKLIEESLNAEDREILSQYGEKGIFGEVAELLTGKFGWINLAQFVVQVALFAGALYAGGQVIAVDEPVALIRWSALVLGLFMAMSVIKIMQWQQMQANRIIREVKRVELQIARSISN